MAAGDLPRAVHHVKRFQQLDAAALAGSAELAQVSGSRIVLLLLVLLLFVLHIRALCVRSHLH